MNECVVSIEDGEKGDFCLCKGCRLLVAPTLRGKKGAQKELDDDGEWNSNG